MTSLRETIQSFDYTRPFIAPESWTQGRTIYGGLSAALVLQSVLNTHPELPPLKSMNVTFVGPSSGELAFSSRVLRRGKSVIAIEGDCQAEGSVAVRSMLLFARERVGQLAQEDFRFPSVKAPDLSPALRPDPEFAPRCAFNFEMRQAGGSDLFSGAETPELLVWVKHLDANQVDPTVALVALADALPPAVRATVTRRVPMSSLTWTVDFVRPAQPGEWFLMRSVSRHAAHGYSLQDMEVWNEKGEMVIWGRQCVAVFA